MILSPFHLPLRYLANPPYVDSACKMCVNFSRSDCPSSGVQVMWNADWSLRMASTIPERV